MRLKVGRALFPALQKLAFSRFFLNWLCPRVYHSIPRLEPRQSRLVADTVPVTVTMASEVLASIPLTSLPRISQGKVRYEGAVVLNSTACRRHVCNVSAPAVRAVMDIRPWLKFRSPPAGYQPSPLTTHGTPLLNLLRLVVDAMDAYKLVPSTGTSLLCQTATSPRCFLLLPVCPLSNHFAACSEKV